MKRGPQLKATFKIDAISTKAQYRIDVLHTPRHYIAARDSIHFEFGCELETI